MSNPETCRICGFPLNGGECNYGCDQNDVIISLEDDFRRLISFVFDDPATISEIQKTEMRRAFMAGCWNTLMHIETNPWRLFQVARQYTEFVEKVKAGER
jgi:hypothetical protein